MAPGLEGVNELSISNAAYLSAWNGSTPVKLPLDTAAFDEKLTALASRSVEKQAEAKEKHNTSYQERWQVNW